jgi:hypothetical protein
MDAVLALAVTQLVDRILQNKQASHPAAVDLEPLAVGALEPNQARDVLLLAACYDQSTDESRLVRWGKLRRKLRFPTWRSWWDMALGVAVTLSVVGLIAWLGRWSSFATVWPYLAVAAGWLPRLWRTGKWFHRAWSVARNIRVLDHNVNLLRRVLMRFPASRITGQPLPAYRRTDDRYELLAKLQNVLGALGFHGIVVLVDRVDEPYLINGSAERMQALVWPMLDNKFLKHPGLGVKLLLPIELLHAVEREDRDFYQRARLDKQNLVRSLEWTGPSLFGVADARVKASAAEGQSPTLADLFDGSIDQRRMIEAMASLRVPRHLFKFLYRVLVTHTNAHGDDNPVWRVSSETFETVLALYRRDQEAYERGVGAV